MWNLLQNSLCLNFTDHKISLFFRRKNVLITKNEYLENYDTVTVLNLLQVFNKYEKNITTEKIFTS